MRNGKGGDVMLLPRVDGGILNVSTDAEYYIVDVKLVIMTVNILVS